MTKEEAERHLELLFEQKASVLSGEAMKLAVAALRAQQTKLDRSRWGGCPCCNLLL